MRGAAGLVLATGHGHVAVAVGGAVYLVATMLELAHGTDLLGVVPVDMRDRVVHPLLAAARAGVC